MTYRKSLFAVDRLRVRVARWLLPRGWHLYRTTLMGVPRIDSTVGPNVHVTYTSTEKAE